MSIRPNFKKGDGLIPVITQDYESKKVLMLGYMNQESWLKTVETGKACYFSRSRQKLWVKGETSGNFQIIKEIRIDCDEDTMLLLVEQIGGAACHTGHQSCFYRKWDSSDFIEDSSVVFNPKEVYG